MKKLTIFSSIAAAALAMVGCQEKEIETFQPGNEGSTFELIAEIAQTKTTLDGYTVEWEEDDVIYMVTSGADTPWTTAAEFTYADGKFNTESKIDAGTYTMNALYAASNQAKYHKNTGTTHNLQSIQTQDCENPTAHIKENDALTGTFTANIPSDEPATVNMNHIYTLMQVDIKNTTGKAIEVTKFEMTAEGADIAGIFNVVAFDTPAVSINENPSSTITVNVTGGSVENKDFRPVYFVMAPLSDYSGDVTFRVTDSESNTYTKTVTLNNISFAAGTYNTTPYTISEADVVAPNVTWDLTTASYESATSEKVVWSSEFVNLTLEKGESSTPANNILGGGGNNHTRVYKDHVMTFAPVGKYQIESVEFTVLSDYTDEFAKAVWTNGEASTSGDIVTVTPVECHKKVSAVLGAATRFSAIKVYYSYDEDYELPTVASIAVEGQKTELVQGAEFDFGGTVTATYTNDETADVTSKALFTGYDMSTPGEQTVTVSYTEEGETVTTTYTLTVLSADADITDVLDVQLTGMSGTSYSDWSDKKASSSAVYAGNSAAGNSSIQLRSNNNNSGVVTTTSGGYATKVVVEWNAATAEGRILQVYAKNSAYTAATDLYDDAKKGTLIGTIVMGTSTELEISADYQYIGFRSASSAMYLSEVKITWSAEASGVTPKSERELAFSYSSVTATLGDDFTEPTLNGVKTDVTYTSSNTTVATVDPSTGAVELLAAGTTTITASAPETDEYNAGSAKYTLTVKEPQSAGTETVECTFSDFAAGTQYAADEAHVINDALTLYTTECHFTTELRIYSSSTHNGYVTSNQLPGAITNLSFNAGNKVDVLNVYGSTDGSAWTLVKAVYITSTSYKDYSVDFTGSYTYFKLDVEGVNQVRLKSLSVTYNN